MALKVALGVIANKIACDETNRSLCLNLPRETLADRMHAFRKLQLRKGALWLDG